MKITKTLQRKLVNLRYRMKQVGYEFNDKDHICILPYGYNHRSLKREAIIKDVFHYTIQPFRLL